MTSLISNANGQIAIFGDERVLNLKDIHNQTFQGFGHDVLLAENSFNIRAGWRRQNVRKKIRGIIFRNSADLFFITTFVNKFNVWKIAN